jgi:hypothetical protein
MASEAELPRRLMLNPVLIESDISALAGLQGWQIYAVKPADEVSYERIFTTPDGKNFISYVEDFGIGVRYLAVQGPDAAELSDRIPKLLPLVSRDDVLRMARNASTRDERVAAVYHIAAVSTPRFDSDLFQLILEALESDDAEVRKAAIFASSYPAWRELEIPLQRARANDTDPAVRELADITIKSITRHVWNPK